MSKSVDDVTPDMDMFELGPIPDEVAKAQQCVMGVPFGGADGKNHSQTVHLFFSFDIVNSTRYKALNLNWPIIIQSLLSKLPSLISRMEFLRSSFLWCVIGDEMVFVLPIQAEEEIAPAVDEIFELTQRVTGSLQDGRFYELLSDQRLGANDIAILKSQNMLSLKTAAWIAVVNDKLDSPYDNISFTYPAGSNNQEVKEYLGKDIDAGFRLKGYTQDRRLVVSFELAYFLIKAERKSELHIIDYVRLKGVWNEGLYPIIWYYNPDSAPKDERGKNIEFAKSFRYDETDNNPLLQRYFSRGEKNRIAVKEGQSGPILARGAYRVDSAIDKISKDRNLKNKLQYISDSCRKIYNVTHTLYVQPLELHCAVVCCDVQNKKIMIVKRGQSHTTNPGKWEFGCAKAISEEPLVKTIEKHYKKLFGVEIELVMDDKRKEKQPHPIAVYEIDKNCPSKKGIIFVAKVLSHQEFRPQDEHDKIDWITEDQLKNYTEDNTVSDFEQTATLVFQNFNKYFPEMGEHTL